MVWFGAGIFFLGLSLLLAYFFSRHNKQNETTTERPVSLGKHKSPEGKKAGYDTGLLRKYLQKGKIEEIEKIIDDLENLPADNQQEIKALLNDCGFSERYKALLSDRDYQVRVKAVTRLGLIGGPGTSDIIFEAMADKNEEVRLAAAEAIRVLKDPSVIPQLIGALNQPNKWLPARIAEVLLFFGNRAVPAMIEALEKEDPVVKAYLIEILGETQDPGIVPALARCLRDTDSQVRLQAVRALGKCREEGTAELLMETVNDPEPKIQIQALRSLALKSAPSMIEMAGEKLNSSEPKVRLAAFDLLKNMGEEGLEIIKEVASTVDHPMAGQAMAYINKMNTGK